MTGYVRVETAPAVRLVGNTNEEGRFGVIAMALGCADVGFAQGQTQGKMCRMAKKTGMSDSSLWIMTVILLALAAWMYFKR